MAYSHGRHPDAAGYRHEHRPHLMRPARRAHSHRTPHDVAETSSRSKTGQQVPKPRCTRRPCDSARPTSDGGYPHAGFEQTPRIAGLEHKARRHLARNRGTSAQSMRKLVKALRRLTIRVAHGHCSEVIPGDQFLKRPLRQKINGFQHSAFDTKVLPDHAAERLRNRVLSRCDASRNGTSFKNQSRADQRSPRALGSR